MLSLMKTLTIRLPESEKELIEAAAKGRRQSVNAFVVSAALDASQGASRIYPTTEEVKERMAEIDAKAVALEAADLVVAGVEQIKQKTGKEVKPASEVFYRCRICGFKAKSPKAKCPMHPGVLEAL